MAEQTPQNPAVPPHLNFREEFEDVLSNYHTSSDGVAVMRNTPFVALVGPTSGGRNTVINEMIKNGYYHFLVSDTTRPRRENNGVWEQQGKEYFFRTEAEMLDDLKKGLYIEAELIHSQQVSGTSIREVQKARDEGKIALSDVDIMGGIHIASLKPDALVIYLTPPSFEEWLHRIKGRTEVGVGELRNRLDYAITGFRLALENDAFHFVVNRTKEEAAQAIDEMARLGVRRPEEEQATRQLVSRLCDQTVEFLWQMPDQ